MQFLKGLGFVENENTRICIFKNRGLQRIRERQKELRAGKEFSVIGKDELFGKILAEQIIRPPPSRILAPLAQHLSAENRLLHRKHIDVLYRPTRALIVEVEFPERVHAVTEEFDSRRTPHQWRENVDNSATNRKLAGSAHRFLPQIPGADEMFGKQFL